MRLDAITLEHFRNYAHQSVTFDPSVNVIVGENAQGKTNLLEAAVYLSCAKSPRARTEKEMISFDADTARLTGSVFSRGRDFTVEIELFRGKRRKMSVNQVPCKRAGDLSGVLNTVYFCPDDLLLIRDGAAARRRFMDLSLSQLRPRYDAALSEYNRLYDHKTRILRDAEEHPSLLDALPDFNLRMAQCGAVLIYYRARFCKLLADYAASAHCECSGGRAELTLAYRTVRTVADPMAPPEMRLRTNSCRRGSSSESTSSSRRTGEKPVSSRKMSRSASLRESAAVRVWPCEEKARAAAPPMETSMSSLCGPERQRREASSAW